MKHEAIRVSRRAFVGGLLASTAMSCAFDGTEGAPRTLRVWVFADAHVGTDLEHGRRSLAEAILQSEGAIEGAPSFEWDVALQLGDMSGTFGPPDDAEGRKVTEQYGVAKVHLREQFYDLAGNHDASGPGEAAQWWFQKWIDPMGEHTACSGVDATRRPYPITGTWERYSFRIGNLLFLMMADRNDLPPPAGRAARGGYPAGGVTSETFRWWQDQIFDNPDSVIVSAHHHMLRETTVGSGDWEGYEVKPDGTFATRYHCYFPEGGPEGASYLYFLDGVPKAMAFEKYLEENPGSIDLWLGGHTHALPDDEIDGRGHIAKRWGVTFINASPLTRYHAHGEAIPMSRLLTFTDGSPVVRVQCYLHTDQLGGPGFYEHAEGAALLGKPFRIG